MQIFIIVYTQSGATFKQNNVFYNSQCIEKKHPRCETPFHSKKFPGVDVCPKFFDRKKTSDTLTRQGLGQYLLEASRVEVSHLGPGKLEV